VPAALYLYNSRDFAAIDFFKKLKPVFAEHTGDVNDGDHLVGLHFGPFRIDNPATPILFNYQIVNSGHQNQAETEKALFDGASALSDVVFKSGSAWVF
jgi:hypothetical protein